jgi:chaperonin GroES
MKKNYIPLEDRVVVTIPKREEKTESGIYIPEDVKTTPLKEVEVLAVGDGTKGNGHNITMFVKPGQKVVIGQHTGANTEYKEGETTFRIVKQEDILFIVDDSK